MSDRFYTQMAEHYNLAPWELNIALRDRDSALFKSLEKKSMPKVTRKDLSAELSGLTGKELVVTKLPLATLEIIVSKFKTKKLIKVDMPSGRLKAPYIAAMHEGLSIPSTEAVDFSTATVALMKELLECINESSNSI